MTPTTPEEIEKVASSFSRARASILALDLPNEENGLVTVPAEPTQEMLDSVINSSAWTVLVESGGEGLCRAIYCAMIQAASQHKKVPK